MKTLLTLIIASFSMLAFAQTGLDQGSAGELLPPIRLNEELTVKSGDTKIIPLGRYTFVDRLSLEVKNGTFCKEDSIRVSFDGIGAQSLNLESGVKGYRTKILSVGYNTRTIEVYNSSDCKVKIKGIEVLPRRWNQNPGGGHGGPVYIPMSEASAQVSFLLESMMYVESFVGDADRINVVSPSKKVLGKALAALNSNPETSQASLRAIKDVVDYLNSVQPFFDRLASIDSLFEVSTEMQSVKMSLERMIR